MHKKKWILFGTYRPPSQNASYSLDELGKTIDHYISHCKNLIALDGFNIEVEHAEMKGGHVRGYLFLHWFNSLV